MNFNRLQPVGGIGRVGAFLKPLFQTRLRYEDRHAVMHRRDEFFLASKVGIMVDGVRRGVDCSPDAVQRLRP